MKEQTENTEHEESTQEITGAVASIIKDFGKLASALVHFMEEIDLACEEAFPDVIDNDTADTEELPEKEEELPEFEQDAEAKSEFEEA